MYNCVGIIGLGLIGGSIAKAFKARLNINKIIAYNRNEDVLIEAKKDGTIDEYTLKIDSSFKNCDIIFICTPVDTICEFTKRLYPIISEDCIITDVGSTKSSIFDYINEFLPKLKYIGGHPMTGSERFRYSCSKEHLFENAYYIVIPSNNIKVEALEEFTSALNTIGAIPVTVSPKEHDHIVATISHVPHIIASTLVNSVKRLETNDGIMKRLAAGGFKDITRIASSSPLMWESICFENKEEILKVLTSYENTLREFRLNLENNSHTGISKLFKDAKEYRDSFSGDHSGPINRNFEIVVDVVDKPGSIAVIAVLLSSNNVNIKNISIINNREVECGVLLISFSLKKDLDKAVILLKEHNYEVQIKQ